MKCVIISEEMKCVIIAEEKIIDLGKRCLSNLLDILNNEYFLGFNEVKRLRTLFFLACQKVVGEQQKSKENSSFIEKLYILNLNLNKVWNEKLEEKFWEAVNYVKKSKVGDKSKVEEVFNTPVCDKYSRKEFSLEEIYKIFNLVKCGVDKCFEINEDLYFDIKNFKYIYDVYNFRYKSLDRF